MAGTFTRPLDDEPSGGVEPAGCARRAKLLNAMREPIGDSSAFAELEVGCATETAAAAESIRRQLLETDPETVEWIYLRNLEGRWVARRVLRQGPVKAPEVPGSKSLLGKIGDFLLALVSYQP